MQTLKVNKKDLKKEYINYCNDLGLKNNKESMQNFANTFIYYKSKIVGFYSAYFKVKDIEKIKKEIIDVLMEV